MRRAMLVLSFVCTAMAAQHAIADVWQHRFTVAANPEIAIRNDDVDDILKEMNSVMHGSAYGNPWDAPCPDVEFVRQGDVIQDSRLPKSGAYGDLVASLKRNAPQANVLIVLWVDCGGSTARGCDHIGLEHMAVARYPTFDSQLWLHERGHAVGRQHSADRPKRDNNVEQQVGMRFMFWLLGVGHLGKTPEECLSFQAQTFPSIIKTASAGGTRLAAAPAGLMAAAVAPAPPPVAVPNRAAVPGADVLTEPAYELVAAPWVHGVPVDEIKSLSREDLDSIRKMLQGPVNPYWAQAMSTLATAGDENDLSLLNAAVALPMDQLAPDANRAERDRYRALLTLKLAAPRAIGIIANRLQSAAAVESLKRLSTMETATSLVGAGNASDLSKEALNGLSIANHPAATSYLRALPTDKVAPLTTQDRSSLIRNSTVINRRGLETFLRSE